MILRIDDKKLKDGIRPTVRMYPDQIQIPCTCTVCTKAKVDQELTVQANEGIVLDSPEEYQEKVKVLSADLIAAREKIKKLEEKNAVKYNAILILAP